MISGWSPRPKQKKCFELLKCLQSQKRLAGSSLQCDQTMLLIYCYVSQRGEKLAAMTTRPLVPKCYFRYSQRLLAGRETGYRMISKKHVPEPSPYSNPPPWNLDHRHPPGRVPSRSKHPRNPLDIAAGPWTLCRSNGTRTSRGPAKRRSSGRHFFSCQCFAW